MGILDIGDKLPTVKEVVAEVAVNPNTVMKAYWQLEHEGLVEGRQGVGTFVARRPAGPPPATQHRPPPRPAPPRRPPGPARPTRGGAGWGGPAARASRTTPSRPCCARRCYARG